MDSTNKHGCMYIYIHVEKKYVYVYSIYIYANILNEGSGDHGLVGTTPCNVGMHNHPSETYSNITKIMRSWPVMLDLPNNYRDLLVIRWEYIYILFIMEKNKH